MGNRAKRKEKCRVMLGVAGSEPGRLTCPSVCQGQVEEEGSTCTICRAEWEHGEHQWQVGEFTWLPVDQITASMSDKQEGCIYK